MNIIKLNKDEILRILEYQNEIDSMIAEFAPFWTKGEIILDNTGFMNFEIEKHDNGYLLYIIYSGCKPESGERDPIHCSTCSINTKLNCVVMHRDKWLCDKDIAEEIAREPDTRDFINQYLMLYVLINVYFAKHRDEIVITDSESIKRHVRQVKRQKGKFHYVYKKQKNKIYTLAKEGVNNED